MTDMSRPAFLLEIKAAPDGLSEIELLEMALAAASLDLDLAVSFKEAGLGHLLGASARGWRQLVDHDLAQLYCFPERPGDDPGMPGVVVLDAATDRELRRGRRLLSCG